MKQITAEWKKKEIGRKISYYFLFEYVDMAGLGLLQIRARLKRVLGIRHAESCDTVELLCNYWSGYMADLFFCD